MVFRAKLRRLEFETRQGKLIEAAIVKARWAAILVVLKERILAVPDKLAPELTALTNERQTRDALKREMNTCSKRSTRTSSMRVEEIQSVRHEALDARVYAYASLRALLPWVWSWKWRLTESIPVLQYLDPNPRHESPKADGCTDKPRRASKRNACNCATSTYPT
jgi:phage terminase large subunit GpA-like protein